MLKLHIDLRSVSLSIPLLYIWKSKPSDEAKHVAHSEILQMLNTWSWRDDTAAMGVYSSYRGSEFHSQHQVTQYYAQLQL